MENKQISIPNTYSMPTFSNSLVITVKSNAEEHCEWPPCQCKRVTQKKISILLKDLLPYVGCGGVVSTLTFYRLDGQGIEFWWGKIFCTHPDRPWRSPHLPYNGYQVIPGGKGAEVWC